MMTATQIQKHFDIDLDDAREIRALVKRAEKDGKADLYKGDFKSSEFADDVQGDIEHMESLYLLDDKSLMNLYLRTYSEAQKTAPRGQKRSPKREKRA